MKATLSDNAKIVLEKRYLLKDRSGRVRETPDDMFKRVADAVAAADQIYDPRADVQRIAGRFQKMMSNMWFLPNSPTLMNAGRELGQLAACFVLPIEDSMESIFETVKHTAMIHKSGGGTGFSFSRIRPAHDIVRSTAGVSSGPLSFMAVFDMATETVKQGGTRRGANMGLLRVDHPDIEAFIDVKNDTSRLNNFNLSVAVTDRFMAALAQDKDYALVNPRTGKPVLSLPARRIFDKIIQSAWLTGEPGIIFIDEINRHNPVQHLGAIEATNPCGEQPLLPNESCTLGSINLSKMMKNNAVDWDRLQETVWNAVHFLDNVIDVNRYPLPQIEATSKQTRKIGLGIMGFADLLMQLDVAYDSEDAVQQGETLMAFIKKTARAASAALAEKRGNFPAYKGSIYDTPDTPHMRNATTTTIAPTGTISIIAGASSGIEPIFSIVQKRNVLDGQHLSDVHPLFAKAAGRKQFFTEELKSEIARRGSIQEQKDIPKNLRRIFKISHDIDPEWHVKIQAAFQKQTHNAVSKTVNLPMQAPPAQVREIFLKAHQLGCKGVTIYRYGSRQHQVLTFDGDSEKAVKIVPRPRPRMTKGLTERIQTGCGKLYVTVNSDGEGVCEVFAQMGKTGGCASSQIEAAGRLVSLALRSGIQPDAIIKQLIGIRCPSPSWQNGKMVLSCPDAMAQVLKHITRSTYDEKEALPSACPECGATMAHEEGCLICHECGFSKCS